MVEFASVVDAVLCAIELQREMSLRNDGVSQERRIAFRIGINLGDVIIEDDDIYGDGVNVTARLETLAERGGICVSRVVGDQVRDKVDFGFEDLGEPQIKNIARPVRVYRIPLAETARTKPPLPLHRRKDHHGNFVKAAAPAHLGRVEDERACVRRFCKLRPGSTIGSVRTTLGRLWRPEYSLFGSRVCARPGRGKDEVVS